MKKINSKINLFKKTFPDITKSGVSFSQISSMGIGGEVAALCDVKNMTELCEIVKFLNEHKIPYFVLGKGSNVVCRDEGYEGVVIRLVGEFSKIKRRGNFVYAGAGVNLFFLGTKLSEIGLGGLEFAYGIPGSVGGAAAMNAGAFGGQMQDRICWVEVLENNKIKKYFNKNCNFSYRNSIFLHNFCIILRVCFKFFQDDKENIVRRQQFFLEKRKQTQPTGLRSAGSVFKRKNDFVPAKVIDELGLKGKTVGGAMVSKIHAGFIVNLGFATCQDFLNLVSYIQNLVYNKHKQKLELEIYVLGEKK